jgi:RimJ/RimL family protein N-acetyltransferase
MSVPPGTMWLVPLREVRSEDIPVFHEYQADPEASALAGVPSRDREAYEAHWAKLRADPEVLLRTIVTADGSVAGQLLSFPRDGVREIGYWLGRAFWGHGIATAALAEFLPLVTERPVYGVVTEANVASRRVLERNGFVLAERHERESPLPDSPPATVLVFRLDG